MADLYDFLMNFCVFTYLTDCTVEFSSMLSGIDFWSSPKGECSRDCDGVEADTNLKSLCPPIAPHSRRSRLRNPVCQRSSLPRLPCCPSSLFGGRPPSYST